MRRRSFFLFPLVSLCTCWFGFLLLLPLLPHQIRKSFCYELFFFFSLIEDGTLNRSYSFTIDQFNHALAQSALLMSLAEVPYLPNVAVRLAPPLRRTRSRSNPPAGGSPVDVDDDELQLPASSTEKTFDSFSSTAISSHPLLSPLSGALRFKVPPSTSQRSRAVTLNLPPPRPEATNTTEHGGYCSKAGCNCKSFHPNPWRKRSCAYCQHPIDFHATTEFDENNSEHDTVHEDEDNWTENEEHMEEEGEYQYNEDDSELEDSSFHTPELDQLPMSKANPHFRYFPTVQKQSLWEFHPPPQNRNNNEELIYISNSNALLFLSFIAFIWICPESLQQNS